LADELFGRLVELSPEARLEVVRVAEEYQTWFLCVRVCHASSREASRSVERAAAWARLGLEIAERVRGPEGWRNRVKGYAGVHSGNPLRVAGELKTAETVLNQAKRLWSSGSDPLGVLDPGRILDIEASLLRDQRRFGEALVLLDEAVAVGRSPERALIKKGFTLEAMGNYEGAIKTLCLAEPLIEREGDVRMLYMLRFNLAVNYCHLGQYAEAAKLGQRVLELATENGDENEVVRVTWLNGRIAAGLGRSGEARSLLAQARREFARRKMTYDVALALLEEAALLLGEDRLHEVKVLARDLTKVFHSKGVHREALAALRLFQQATEREVVTAELARQILRYLFRARHDQGLRFES
jgi:tetratricopeptide (TPR) repeat protein